MSVASNGKVAAAPDEEPKESPSSHPNFLRRVYSAPSLPPTAAKKPASMIFCTQRFRRKLWGPS
jgi:hypothetical protein